MSEATAHFALRVVSLIGLIALAPQIARAEAEPAKVHGKLVEKLAQAEANVDLGALADDWAKKPPAKEREAYAQLVGKRLDADWGAYQAAVGADLATRSSKLAASWAEAQARLDDEQILAASKLPAEFAELALNGGPEYRLLHDELAREIERGKTCLGGALAPFERKVAEAALAPYSEATKRNGVTVETALGELDAAAAKEVESLKEALAGCKEARLGRLEVFSFQLAVDRGRAALAAEALAEAELAARAAADAQVELARLEGKDVIAPRVECRWESGPDSSRSPGGLSCAPRGLELGGSSVSRIEVIGLPPNQVWKLRASTGEDVRLSKCPGNLAEDEQINVVGTRDNRLEVLVHAHRSLASTHGCGSLVRSRESAITESRADSKASSPWLVTNRTSNYLTLTVSNDSGEVRSATVPLLFRNWSLEAGGFFAVSTLVDDEIATEAALDDEGEAIDGKLRVTALREANNYAQESGAYLAFFPRNYPVFGLGLGFSATTGRATSTYFGPVVRLTGFGDRGLLTFSAGAALRSVRRYPDVRLAGEGVAESDVRDLFGADSAALKGRLEEKVGTFVLVSLGFKFGPVPAAPEGD